MFLRTISLIATVFVLSLNSFPSLADSIPDNTSDQNPPAEREASPMGVMDKLNLTTDQQQKIRDIRSKYQGQISQQMTQLKTEKQKLRELMTGDASDDEIRSQHDQMFKTRQKLEDLNFESMLEMRAVLTTEQRVQFAQMMDQRRQKFRGGSGRFRQGSAF
jgi:Spy/CpxP family protein refolding chaperone